MTPDLPATAVRDLVGYGAHRPRFTWPTGARVAVSLVLNIEDGAERLVARGDCADDVAAHWMPHATHPTTRNLTLESAYEYGARAGIWRVLRTLREFDVRATAFCCAKAMDLNPVVAAALVRDGHEIANHGLAWDTHTDLGADEELEAIRVSSRILSRHAGRPPRTWYSRDGLSPRTLPSLVSEGYTYDCNSFSDDLPYLVHAAGVAVPTVPYAGDTNDSGLVNRFATAGSFSDYLCGALELLLTEPGGWPSVLSVGLHPRLIGRPAYIKALRTFLTCANDNRSTWFATRSEIADYWSARGTL